MVSLSGNDCALLHPPAAGNQRDNDPMNPVPGLKLCEDTTRPAYLNAGAAEKFEVLLQRDTGHAVSKPAHAAAVTWFEKWLCK